MNKLLIALSLSLASFTASSTALFDMPLAKKCDAIAQSILQLQDAQQDDWICHTHVLSAYHQAVYAVQTIAEDNMEDADIYLKEAIFHLNYAQISQCNEADKIIAAERNLEEIRSLLHS